MNKNLPIITENNTIGYNSPPYIIAEIGLNHNGDLTTALEQVKQAAKNGAHCAKFQLYNPELFIYSDAALGDGEPGSLQDFFRQFTLSESDWKILAAETRKMGLDFLCSVFDEKSLEFYMSLSPSFIKIASADIDNEPLLRSVNKTGLPILLSTGTASEAEVEHALSLLNNASSILLFLCVSSYPARPADYNLSVLKTWQEKFPVLTGLSDHTEDNRLAIASVALGACAIEKHFTSNRNLPGPDQSLSIEPAELSALAQDARLIWDTTREKEKTISESEIGVRQHGRRALFASRDIQAGEILNKESIVPLRPGSAGIPINRYSELIGKTINKSIKKGEPVLEDHF